MEKVSSGSDVECVGCVCVLVVGGGWWGVVVAWCSGVTGSEISVLFEEQ